MSSKAPLGAASAQAGPKAPVSMCVIVRDEPLLEQALLSVRPYVEEIVVVITSRGDAASWEVASRIADVVEVDERCNLLDGQMTGEIWNFSIARNRSFDLATKPWILWMDADDVVEGLERLPEVLRIADAGRMGGALEVCAHFPYEYQHDGRGVCWVLQTRERLFSNFARPARFRWMDECHELCLSVDTSRTVILPEMDQIVWKHRRHLSTKAFDGQRNLRIMRKMVQRRPDDLRAKFYFGNALASAGLLDEAIPVLADYVRRSNSEDEKALACLRLVNLCLHKNDLDDAVLWGLRLVATRESWSEGYSALCRAFYFLAQRGGAESQRHWERCVHFGKIAVKMPPTKTAQFVDPNDRSSLHQYLNLACSKIGDIAGALESAKAGFEYNPADENLRLNRFVYEEYLAKNAAKEALSKMKMVSLELRRRYGMAKAGEEAFALLERAVEDPAVLERERANGARPGELQTIAAVAARLVNRPEPIVPSGSKIVAPLDIVFLCGPGWEVWNPEVLRTSGLGGSETAVVEMSKRLAAKGHRVRVYAGCGENKTYEGVEWVNSDWQPSYGKCDVCVVWRNAPMLDLPGEAKVKLLWAHDVWAVGATRENLAKATRVLALSEWHREFMLQHHAQHGLTADKIIKTRNGIDLEKFGEKNPVVYPKGRDPHKVVYSSSADRGLESLLQMWPRIRAQVKDAELHIFYGFYNWEQMAKGNAEATARINAIKSRIFDLQPHGVFYRGRVDQQTLAREMLSAGAMLYPTWFSESSCCHADTRVSVPGDHRGGPPTVRIADMVGKFGFPVYAFNESENSFQLATCKRVWQTKIAEEMVELTLDDGSLLRLTPEHLVLNFDGDWVCAGDICPGASLRALHYRYNVAIRDGSGRWTNEHRLVGEWKAGRKLTRDEVVDHSDLLRLDNRPESLTIMSAREHGSKTHAGTRRSKLAYAKSVESFKRWIQSDEGRAHAKNSGARLGKKIWDKVRSMSPEDRKAWESSRVAKRMSTIAAKKAADPEYAARLLETSRKNIGLAVIESRRLLREDPEYASAVRANIANASAELARLEMADPQRRVARYKKAGERATEVGTQKRSDPEWREQELARLAEIRAGRNHTVASVRRIPGGPVFDMEVDGLHNFVADGVVIHNCLTAMESQAAGLRIVTSPIAALKETVGNRGVMIEGDWMSPEYQSKFVDAAVWALNNPGNRESLQAYAREHFSWDGVADEWEEMMRELLGDSPHGQSTADVEMLKAFAMSTPQGRAAFIQSEPAVQAPLKWSPYSAPAPTVSASSSEKPLLDMILGLAGCGGQVPIDPVVYMENECRGGGTRVGFMGLARAMSERYRVRAFSLFTSEYEAAGVSYMDLSRFEKSADRSVLLAYYDTSPLIGVTGCLRIASHHTYLPPVGSVRWLISQGDPIPWTDVNVAPSQHTVDYLREHYDKSGVWAVLPNGVTDPRVEWNPVPGRIFHHVSPDRGLRILLKVFPEIKRLVPTATLRVVGVAKEFAAYDWNTVTEQGRRALDLREQISVAERHGVVFLGSVLRASLVRELSEANVYAFPLSVESPCESFSVSAMEACMMGVPLVLAPGDALASIYGGHVRMTSAPVENHLDEFAQAVAGVLLDRGEAHRMSEHEKEFAKGYTFERQADALHGIISGFRRVESKLEPDPPRWSEPLRWTSP